MALRQVEDARMARKRHSAEEIVAKLRQVDVLTAQGSRPVAWCSWRWSPRCQLFAVPKEEQEHAQQAHPRADRGHAGPGRYAARGLSPRGRRGWGRQLGPRPLLKHFKPRFTRDLDVAMAVYPNAAAELTENG